MACALVCIALGLHGAGIDVTGVDVATPVITAQAARRVALKNFRGFARPYMSGWTRVGRVSVHLVRVLRSNSVGPLGLFTDQLVWLVVVRDVSIPDLGPPGRPHHEFLGWLGVFVRPDEPRYIVATSF
jgi:hypothetical protein